MKSIITLVIILAAGLMAAAQVDDVRVVNNEEEVFTVLEEDPEFPGGMEALYQYIAANVKYPESAKEKKITGRVFISFVIEKNGTISNITVLRSPDEILSSEAIRVVKAMPKWKPGRVKGKPVRAKFTLPINFKLD